MCMNTNTNIPETWKKALLMLAVKLRADAAESDLSSLVQEHNTLQATLPGNATQKKHYLVMVPTTELARVESNILFLFHQSHK